MKKKDIALRLARNKFEGLIKNNWDEETWEGDALNNSLFFTLQDMMDAYEVGFHEAGMRKFVLLKAAEINELDLEEDE